MSNIVRGFEEGRFPKFKGGFGGCSPASKDRNEATFGWSLVQKTKRRYIRMFPGTKNRNEGTFAKTALSRNRPFVSSRIFGQKGLRTEFTCEN